MKIVERPEKYLFAITAGLILFPYLLYKPSTLFPVNLYMSAATHITIALCVIAGCGIFYALGAVLGRRNRVAVPYMPATAGNFLKFTLWSLTLLSLGTQVFQGFFGLIEYSSGGFQAARKAVAVSGIGVPIRLFIVTVPMIFAVCRPSKKAATWLMAALTVLNVIRAVTMSERNALIEVAAVWLAFFYIYQVKFPRKYIVAGLLGLYLFFAAVLADRLRSQGNEDVDGGHLSSSIAAYYADTMNKYYLALDGKMAYPAVSVLAPITALISPQADGARISYEASISMANQQGYFVAEVLNNPGGLAQDINDFGVVLGHIVIFIKFFVLGFAVVRARTSAYFFSLLPLAVISLLEYPRFNYLHLPFAFYIFIAVNLLWLSSRVTKVALRAS